MKPRVQSLTRETPLAWEISRNSLYISSGNSVTRYPNFPELLWRRQDSSSTLQLDDNMLLLNASHILYKNTKLKDGGKKKKKMILGQEDHMPQYATRGETLSTQDFLVWNRTLSGGNLLIFICMELCGHLGSHGKFTVRLFAIHHECSRKLLTEQYS